MLKVTEVSPQKKNPHRFNIFLDGEFAFGADEDTVVNYRLVVEKEINGNDLEKIIFETQVGKLMQRMYRLFSIRQRSEKEIRDYLKIQNFKLKVKQSEEISQIVIESLVNKLKEKQLLNDLEFAKAWVESRSRNRGQRLLQAELYKKGISREIIEEVLNEKGEEQSESQIKVAEGLLEKKLSRWKNLPEVEKRKKATDFLLRRGFDYSLVRVVVEKSLKK